MPIIREEIKSGGKIQFNLPRISDEAKMVHTLLDQNSGSILSLRKMYNYGCVVELVQENIDITKKTESHHAWT